MNIIRAEIEKGKYSRYAISKATGIDQTALMRIVRGKSCTAETADKLLAFFGYEVKRKRGTK